MSVILIKFTHKADARFFLRINSLQNNPKSSLYKITNNMIIAYYLVIDTTSPYYSKESIPNLQDIKIANTPGIEIVINKTASEDFLFSWAMSEVLNDIKFIPYETKSVLQGEQDHLMGRVIIENNVVITRSFEALFDTMAIMNYTSDSFSDGGKYNNYEALSLQILQHLAHGAVIIDIGVESTRPNAESLSANEEINRLKDIAPIIQNIQKNYTFLLSIDTYHAETILWLLDNFPKFDMINDVSGSLDPKIVKQLISKNKKYIAMHNLGVPTNPHNIIELEKDPIKVISEFFSKKHQDFLQCGISHADILQNIIFDPGIGFGNNQAQAWYILKNLNKIDSYGSALLIGVSRKSFLRHIIANNLADGDLNSAFIAVHLANLVDYVRIHDTILTNKIYKIKANLSR